jgi:hypothetical protein
MLTDQVAYRRDVVATRDEEIRRRDVIILQLTSRIPEIEAPPTPAQTPTPSGGHEDPTQQSAEPEIGGETHPAAESPRARLSVSLDGGGCWKHEWRRREPA